MHFSQAVSDLNGRFDALRRLERVADLVEVTRAEQAAIAISSRIRGSLGRTVELGTRAGVLMGTLDDVGADWLSILARASPDAPQAIVRWSAVEWIRGVDGRVDDRPAPLRPLARALSELAAGRRAVALLMDSGPLIGMIAAVCADHCLIECSPEEDVQIPFCEGASLGHWSTGTASSHSEGSMVVPYAGLVAAIG